MLAALSVVKIWWSLPLLSGVDYRAFLLRIPLNIWKDVVFIKKIKVPGSKGFEFRLQ